MSAFDTTLSNLGINRTTTPPVSTAAGGQSLGQNDFLKLMTAQLKNQDPFAPVDNTQMVAQMAQFSSLAGITEMSTTLKGIADKLGGTSTADALAYVGHTVLTEGATAYGRAAGGIAGAVELDGDTTSLNVSISSADGTVLKNVQLGAHAKGTVEFDWNGKTDAGTDAGPGPFTVTAIAGKDNVAVTSRTLVWAPVSSVTIPATGPAQLSLPGIGTVPVTAVRQVG
jgi:flagellar basal-body rod modification protein FlgD